MLSFHCFADVPSLACSVPQESDPHRRHHPGVPCWVWPARCQWKTGGHGGREREDGVCLLRTLPALGTFLEVAASFHALASGPLQWLQLSLDSSNLIRSLCPLGSWVVMLPLLLDFGASWLPATALGEVFSWASSFASSQLDSVAAET